MAELYGVWCHHPAIGGWVLNKAAMTKEQAERSAAHLTKARESDPRLCAGPHEVRSADDPATKLDR